MKTPNSKHQTPDKFQTPTSNRITWFKDLVPDLVLLKDARIGQQLWARAKARKVSKCAITGVEINIGALAWRPVGNKSNRYLRISEYGLSKLRE